MFFTKEKPSPLDSTQGKESLDQFKQRKQNEDVAYYLNTEDDWNKEYQEEYFPKTPVIQGPQEQKKETQTNISTGYQKERKEWENFYQTHFKEKVDLSKVKIPKKPTTGSWRLIFIKQGLTIEEAFQKCKELFDAIKYTQEPLDEVVTENTRKPTQQHYAIWVKDTLEPDPEYLGKSTQQVDPDMKIGITLLERLILELKYYSETKKHLDIKGATFCTGSRVADGGVPGVLWNGDYSKLRVCWYNLDYSFPEYGLRVAVS